MSVPALTPAIAASPTGTFTPKIVSLLREGYDLKRLKGDLAAGFTVAVIALPLAMALAIASGASPDRGLVTAIIAGFFVSLLGGSRVQIGGPTGAFVVVVANVIAVHGYDGLLLATVMAGLILIVAGYSGLGRIIRYIPHPVVTGFTAGIAVIIATSQLRDLLGLQMVSVPPGFVEKWGAYLKAAGTFQPKALAFGGASLALILLLRRYAPRVPAFLVALVAGAAAVALLGLQVDTVGSRFPASGTGLNLPSLPAFSLAKAQEVLPSAFTIAFLAGIEALLSCVVSDGMTGFRHRSNQELVGQGVANIASAFFGGLPATGAIARTAANVKSGGRTPFAGIFHSAFLLLFVLLGSDLMAFVPMTVLAAVLLVVAWGMSEARRFVLLLRMPIGERAILIATFLLTVLVDLTVAIGVGVTIASFLFMARMSGSGAVTSDQEREDASQRDRLPPGVEVFRISGPFFFGVVGELLEALKRVGGTPRLIILRLEEVPFLDASGAIALEEFFSEARSSGIGVIVAGMHPRLADLMDRVQAPGPGEQPIQVPSYEAALEFARADPPR